MLSDYLESLESITEQLEEEQLNTKSNLEKILGAVKEKQDKLEKEFQESIEKRCMEAVQWWMSKQTCMGIVRVVCVPRVPWKGVSYGIWKKGQKSVPN